MADLQKILKVTQEQYNTLASGGTVGSYTGLNNNYIYLIEKDDIYETTWLNLKTLRDNSKLEIGKKYKIIDYECTTIETNTASAGHQFDIIITAVDVNQLSEEASASRHVGDTYFNGCDLRRWKLWYCLDNDQPRFKWASGDYITVGSTKYYRNEYKSANYGTGTYKFAWSTLDLNGSTRWTYEKNPAVGSSAYGASTGGSAANITVASFNTGKGVIYRMIDEYNNDVGYDFKNILFTKANLYTNAYTFCTYNTNQDKTIDAHNCFDNIIEPGVTDNSSYYVQQQLNFNVMYNMPTFELCKGNFFDKQSYNNSINGNNTNGSEYNIFIASSDNIIRGDKNNFLHCNNMTIYGSDNDFKKCSYCTSSTAALSYTIITNSERITFQKNSGSSYDLTVSHAHMSDCKYLTVQSDAISYSSRGLWYFNFIGLWFSTTTTYTLTSNTSTATYATYVYPGGTTTAPTIKENNVSRPHYESYTTLSQVTTTTGVPMSTRPNTNAKYYKATSDGIIWFSINNDSNNSRTIYVYPAKGSAWITFPNVHNGYGTPGGYQIRVTSGDYVGFAKTDGGAVTVNNVFFIPLR